MIYRGLKTYIILNLMILLGIGMILIDVVMVVTMHRILVSSEIRKTESFLFAIESMISSSESTDICFSDALPVSRIEALSSKVDVSCLLILNTDRKSVYGSKDPCAMKEELDILTRKAIYSNQTQAGYAGKTWGVFWRQPRNLIVASPMRLEGKIIGGIGVVMPLEKIYNMLRRIQLILLMYIALNLLVLAFTGLYRLNRMVIRPVNRLLKRAEGYTEGDFILDEKHSSEFSQLSRALNQMIQRIADDKRQLRDMVESLEQANKELKRTQEDMIRAEKLATVGRLAAGIAHEIGNPISIVIGYLDLLKQSDISPDDKMDFLKRTEIEINRINQVIRQLLDFSRPSGGTLQQISVHAILKDMIRMFKFHADTAGIELIECLESPKDTVFGDPNKLRQVILNLMINAKDALASVKNGTIRLETELAPENLDTSKSGRTIMISVTDNGIGIPKEHILSIFDPFFTTKEPGKGTGLGLSVSLSLIESMGGTIRAFSESNNGTRMTIYLPIFSPKEIYES